MQPPFSNFKAVALILCVAGLIFASGFIAARTLLPTGTSIDSSGGATSSDNSTVKLGTTELDVIPGGSSVSSGNPSVTVWVNTKSGVYHCPKTRWYGNTKQGEYMTQKDAQSKGYRPAYGIVCG